MPVSVVSAPVQFVAWIGPLLKRLRSWLGRRSQRKLRLCESLALGEKRSVAVIEFEHARFLLGCTGAAITLLSQLPGAGEDPEGRPCQH